MKLLFYVLAITNFLFLPVATLSMWHPDGAGLTLEEVRANDRKMIEELIDRWQLTKEEDIRFAQRFPLHMAAMQNDEPTLILLLRKSRKPNEQCHSSQQDDYKIRSGRTPLHFAALHAGPSVVSQLLANDAFPEITEEYQGATPLHFVVMTTEGTVEDKLAKIQMLISHSKESFEYVNATDKKGNTPLHFAARIETKNPPAVLGLLVEHGADLTQTNNDGETPYDVARRGGNTTFIDYFQEGEVALVHQACKTLDQASIRRLTQKMHLLFSQDSGGNSLLHTLYVVKRCKKFPRDLKELKRAVASTILSYQELCALYNETLFFLGQGLYSFTKNRKEESVETLAQKNKLAIILNLAQKNVTLSSQCLQCNNAFQKDDLVLVTSDGEILHATRCASLWYLRRQESLEPVRLTRATRQKSTPVLPTARQSLQGAPHTQTTSVRHRGKRRAQTTKSTSVLPPMPEDLL